MARRMTRARVIVRIIAATGAALGAVVLAACLVFDLRVTLFTSGSMAPAIPTGSAAISRGIPAAEIEVGDVVTVDRPEALPLTHRVTEVTAPAGEAAATRRITMRGDANAVVDPVPYDVERVRVVLFSVPGIAPMFDAVATVVALAIMTAPVTALVVVLVRPDRVRPRPERA